MARRFLLGRTVTALEMIAEFGCGRQGWMSQGRVVEKCGGPESLRSLFSSVVGQFGRKDSCQGFASAMPSMLRREPASAAGPAQPLKRIGVSSVCGTPERRALIRIARQDATCSRAHPQQCHRVLIDSYGCAGHFHDSRLPSEVVLNEEDGMKSPCAVNLHNAVTVSQQRPGETCGAA